MTTLVIMAPKRCRSDQIRNPATGRCVKRDGKIGKQILKKRKKPSLRRLSSRRRPSNLVAGKFKLGKRVGRGAFGQVFMGENPKTGKTVAIKVFESSEQGEREARTETKNLERLGGKLCKDFVCIIDSGEFKRKPFVVMDLVRGQNGEKFFKNKIRDNETSCILAKDVYRKATNALKKLHRAGIAHNDVKLDNLIVEETGSGGVRVRIIDFGLTCSSRTCPASGAPLFMAPFKERAFFDRTGISLKNAQRADFFALAKSVSANISRKKTTCFRGFRRELANDTQKFRNPV